MYASSRWRCNSSISARSLSSFRGLSSFDICLRTVSFRCSSRASSSMASCRSTIRSSRSLLMFIPITSVRNTYPRGWSAYLTNWGGGPPTFSISSFNFATSSVSYLMASPNLSFRSNHGSSFSLWVASAAASAADNKSPDRRNMGTSFLLNLLMTFKFSSRSSSLIT